VILVAAVVVAMAVPCTGASAGTVGLNAAGSIVFYAGGTGESNNIFYAPGAQANQHRFEERNPAATLITGGAGGRCTQQSERVVVCTDPDIAQVNLAMGDGNDTFSGGGNANAPRIHSLGEDGNDVLGGTHRDDTINGGPGDDQLNPSGSSTFNASTNGNDRVVGGSGDDTIRGFDGADNLFGEAGADDLSGGTGGDLLDGGPDNDVLNGGAGDDAVHGGAGADALHAGGGAIAGAVVDGSGADTYKGNDGRDTVIYGGATAVSVTMEGEPGDGPAGENDDVGTDVEDLVTGSGNDRLTGSTGANQIQSGGGDDVVAGGEGDDTLDGGAADPGNDSLAGGPGDDTIASGPGDDSIEGGDGRDSGDGGGGTDTVEGGDSGDAVMGGAGSDTVRGGSGDDSVMGAVPALVGADGTDRLTGGDGDDVMLGGDGDDTLDGGDGGDLIKGDAGDDTADYSRRLGGVRVSVGAGANDGTVGERDDVVGDVELVKGGGGGDTLMGDGNRNTLDGGPGEDYLDGGGGGDAVAGGDSGDVIRSRNDTADSVGCGGGRADFVIADGADEIDPDCPAGRIDRGGDQRPTAGRRVVAAPAVGSLRMSPSRIRRRVPLIDSVLLPVGSLVDAGGGTVQMSVAGVPQPGQFRGGAFRIRQKRGPRPLTELVLSGGSFSRRACRAGGARAAARPRRRLFSNARGRFRTRGRRSTATVRGTAWLTQDTCAGTLTRVTRGSVVVRDFRLRKNVVVRAGRRYLARSPR
jgi:Ca2+-binding RTX toxin-like protein